MRANQAVAEIIEPAAGVYVRISRDDEGDELGVARQERACRELAERKGWRVAEVYRDNDISASGYSKRRRPDYARMMTDVAAGTLDVIVAWDLDRITRRPSEAERMWDALLEAGDVRVATVGGDDVDLRTGEGLMVARIKLAVAAEEVRKMSRRIRSKHQELAEKGLPVGLGAAGLKPGSTGWPFGYQRGGMVIDEGEATILRQAAKDVLAGIPVTSIARQWNEAGVRSPFPRKTELGWRAQSVVALLMSPRPAGLRRHIEDGIVVLYKAQWPAILDLATHEQLVSTLGANRGKGDHPRRRSLLTGLVRCGLCGANMTRSAKHGAPTLMCPKGPGKDGCGGVSIGADLAEGAIVRRVIAHIEQRASAGVEAIMAQGADSEAARIAGELQESEQTKLRLAERLALADFDDAEIAAMRKANKSRIADLRSRLDALTQESTLARWDTVAEFEAEFAASDTDTRRALLARVIDHATVLPYQGKRRDPSRVQVDFRK